MKEESIAAIVTICVQTGYDKWTNYTKSKEFSKTATIQEIEQWAKSFGENLTIFDVTLSEIYK